MGKKNQPAVIFSTQLAIPFAASKNFKATYWAPSFQLNLLKPIKKWILSASSGFFWDGFNTSGSFIYNAGATYNLNPQWSFTNEWFGFISGNLPQHSSDVSIAYNLHKRIQFGCTAGKGISAAAHKNYLAIDGIWVCSVKRKK